MDVPGNLGGSAPIANWLNKLRAAILARTILPGIGYKLRPSTGGVVLEVLPGAGGGNLQTYRVKSASGDYLVCRTWDGTTEGEADVNIAKNFDSRQLTSEVLDSTTYTYTYSGLATVLNRLRTNNLGEQQQVTPLWKLDGIIVAQSVSYSGVTVSGNDLKLIEVSSRCWARV